MSNKNFRNAEEHLSDSDQIMARLVSDYGPCPLGTDCRDPFDALVSAIVSQQLSAKAAASIQDRLQAHIGARRPFEPAHFLPHSVESLRATGLSAAKARWVLHLAGTVDSGEINLGELADQPDAAVIESLIAMPGIGRWTAEMFLIFSLGRSDVLSLTDTGLRRAVRALYDLSDLDDQAFRQLADPWRPYRSIASWYLWRFLDSPR